MFVVVFSFCFVFSIEGSRTENLMGTFNGTSLGFDWFIYLYPSILPSILYLYPLITKTQFYCWNIICWVHASQVKYWKTYYKVLYSLKDFGGWSGNQAWMPCDQEQRSWTVTFPTSWNCTSPNYCSHHLPPALRTSGAGHHSLSHSFSRRTKHFPAHSHLLKWCISSFQMQLSTRTWGL